MGCIAAFACFVIILISSTDFAAKRLNLFQYLVEIGLCFACVAAAAAGV